MMRQILLAGMPSSGKSTYIAALRYLLNSAEVPSALEQTRLSANEEHFNMLEGFWLDAQRMERTKRPTEAWVTLHVRDVETGAIADLSLPDLQGERFEQPAAAGLCHRPLFDALTSADGLILFTNADSGTDDLMIAEVDAVGAQDGDAPAASAVVRAPRPFNPYEMPEEAKIVELLQSLNRRPIRSRPRKLAVIISGWDAVVVAGDRLPEQWLREQRPMLAQFIRYNPNLWSWRAYGVSAQGGPLPGDAARLKKIRKPAQRVRIVGHGSGEHDLSAPVRWLMASEGA